MDYEKDGCIDAGSAIKWTLGNSAEAFSVERWKKMGVWEANSVKFYEREHVVSGELDCVVKNPRTEGLIGIEVKSFYGHYAAREIAGAKRPPIPGCPKRDNFLQALVYRHNYRDILEQYRLYYIERGNGFRVEFEVGIDPEGDDYRPFWRQIEGPYWNCFSTEKVKRPFLVRDVYARYKELANYLRAKELPPRDYTWAMSEDEIQFRWTKGKLGKTDYEKWKKAPEKVKLGDWQCSYCDWRNQCQNDSIGE
jgi:hypothetical protein